MFAIRRELLEFGALPIGALLHHLDSTTALQNLLKQLLDSQEAQHDGTKSWMPVAALATCLSIPVQHAKVLAVMLEAIAPEHTLVVQRPEGQSDPLAVDTHALLLYFFAQLHMRQAARPDAMDVWPSAAQQEEKANSSQLLQHHQQAVTQLHAPHHGSPGAPHMQNGLGPGSPVAGPLREHLQAHGSEQPGSPAVSTSSRSSTGSQPGMHFQHKRSNHLVRKELQQHLFQLHQQLAGYTDFVQRHAQQLLSLTLRSPPTPGSSLARTQVTAAEFDSLCMVLRQANVSAAAPEGGGSPMDVVPTPFSDDRLSQHVPLFSDSAPAAALPALAEWLAANILDEAQGAETLGTSPGQASKWGPLAPAGVVQSGVVDIQGVCKSTVARGEDDFPAGVVRVMDCHDSVVYILAPLQYASISGCTDCMVVVGAVARLLRLERCERLQVYAASRRVCINSCHECTFYLGVNTPPLLLGDNRSLQMAPYCTQYQRLPEHMAVAGVAAEPNCWDQHVSLAREHRHATPDSHCAPDEVGAAGPGMQPRSAVQLLPPEGLLPFMVPFQGGPGFLCGGAASHPGPRVSGELGAHLGLSSSSGLGSLASAGSSLLETVGSMPGHAAGAAAGSSAAAAAMPPCPFQLPGAYEEAKQRKVQSVAELRQAVKQAVLDEGRKKELQSVIQAHFKDWLVSSNRMREVFDLARLERGGDGEPFHNGSGPQQ